MASKLKDSDSREAEQLGAETQEEDRLLDSMREERIRRCAYEIYLERGGEPGHDWEDWLQAEREIRNNAAQNA
jgi:hypothetical protein